MAWCWKPKEQRRAVLCIVDGCMCLLHSLLTWSWGCVHEGLCLHCSLWCVQVQLRRWLQEAALTRIVQIVVNA